VRFALRGGLVALALLVLYVSVTFFQVWTTSGRDDAEPADAASADAIVVLGAAQYNGVPSPALEGRLEHALELYQQGMADQVVVTGGNQPGDEFTEALTGYNWLREHGVPDEDLIVITDGTSTWESLAAASNVLESQGMTDVVLVSDPYHSYRLLGIAGELGLDAQVSPTDAGSGLTDLLRETAAVSVGRLISYRRLLRFEP